MNIKKFATVFAVACFISLVIAQRFKHAGWATAGNRHSIQSSDGLNPGVDRWAIKTSLQPHAQQKTVSLKTLLSLDNPIDHEMKEYETERIPNAVSGDLKEGDLITTTGWLELVALEDDSKKHRDGDYHIQLRMSKEWGDTCLIVEIPLPDFIEDSTLRDSCTKTRKFIKGLIGDLEPSTRGTVLTNPPLVKVTGQLFFDAVHLNNDSRGKSPKGFPPMHSYTCWELHPVIAIEFAEIEK